jgi:NADP-dependent 3-hydroxy acid dehydrogenase YdfG
MCNPRRTRFLGERWFELGLANAVENLIKNTRGPSGIGHRRRPRHRPGDRVGIGRTRRQVIATDLTPPHETVRKIGPTAHALLLDVTQEEQWHSVSLKSRDVGEVDIVVNNAGYFPNRSIDELDLPTWRKTMATNLDSHFLSAKYFLPTMRKKKWGRFVGISSNMVGLAIPGMSHYIATKMGITPTSSHTYLKLVRLPSSVIAARIQCVAGTRENFRGEGSASARSQRRLRPIAIES